MDLRKRCLTQIASHSSQNKICGYFARLSFKNIPLNSEFNLYFCLLNGFYICFICHCYLWLKNQLPRSNQQLCTLTKRRKCFLVSLCYIHVFLKGPTDIWMNLQTHDKSRNLCFFSLSWLFNLMFFDWFPWDCEILLQ